MISVDGLTVEFGDEFLIFFTVFLLRLFCFYPLQPLVSAVMGVLLLHEVITPSFVVGAVLICAGVVVTFLPTKAKE